MNFDHGLGNRPDNPLGGRSAQRRRLLVGVTSGVLGASLAAAGLATAAGAATTSGHRRPGRHHQGAVTTGRSGGDRRGGTGMPPAEQPPGWPGEAGGLFGVVTEYTPASGSSSGTLDFTEADGTAVTVATTGSTAFRAPRGAPPVVVAGDEVTVRPTQASRGTSSIVAAVVEVSEPSLSGTVVSVSGQTVTISDASLFRRIVNLSATTTFYLGKTEVQGDPIGPGSHIIAVGQLDPTDMQLDATAVEVTEQFVTGTVGTISDPSFTMTTGDGHQITVTTTGSTQFYAGGAAGSFDSLGTRDRVAVIGSQQSGSGVLATVVRVLPARPAEGPASGGGSAPSPGQQPGGSGTHHRGG